MKDPFIFLCSEITRDMAMLLCNWMRNESVRKYLSDSRHVSRHIEETVSRVNLPVLTHLFNQDGRFYIACDKNNNPVGFVRLVKKDRDYEIVIAIGEQSNWNRKLGTGTLREAVKIAFFEFRADRVIAKIKRENKRSQRVFANAGFEPDYKTDDLTVFSLTMDRFLHRIKGVSDMTSDITITKIDKERIAKILNTVSSDPETTDKAVKALECELERAAVVEPVSIPRDVVTMNTRALVQLNDEEMEVSLVYPHEADADEYKLSVLSPVGTAILGYREGNVIEWDVPSGIAKIWIKKVLYQPEAAGRDLA